jgi:tetratricopeptide (TPR) repeat protein
MTVEPMSVARPLPPRWKETQRVFAASLLGVCLFGLPLLLALQASGQVSSPEALYREADAAYDRGDVQQAIRFYEQLLKVQPDFVAARTNLGIALAHNGRYSEAVAQYNQALNHAPDNPIVLINLALAWYKTPDFDKAAAVLEHLHSLQPENRQALYLLGDCFLRQGRNLDVVALLQPVYDADPRDHVVDYELALALIYDGQIQKGQAVIDQVVKIGSPLEANLLTAAAQLGELEYKSAAITMRKALEAVPDLPGGWTLLARALLGSEDRAGAKTAFLKAIQADANDFDANLYLGGILLYDGSATEAAPYLEKAHKLRPSSDKARFQMGLLNKARGRLEDALADWQQVERQSPDFLQVHTQLAMLYAQLHRTSDSERERALVLQQNEKDSEQAPIQKKP